VSLSQFSSHIYYSGRIESHGSEQTLNHIWFILNQPFQPKSYTKPNHLKSNKNDGRKKLIRWSRVGKKVGWEPRTPWVPCAPPRISLRWRSIPAMLWDHRAGHALDSVALFVLAYQPPASSIFLSEQTSHQQSASSTFLSEQTSTSHQPNEQVVCFGTTRQGMYLIPAMDRCQEAHRAGTYAGGAHEGQYARDAYWTFFQRSYHSEVISRCFPFKSDEEWSGFRGRGVGATMEGEEFGLGVAREGSCRALRVYRVNHAPLISMTQSRQNMWCDSLVTSTTNLASPRESFAPYASARLINSASSSVMQKRVIFEI
jgi:hypothetical protein